MRNYFFIISKILLYVVPFCLVIVSPSTLFPFIVGKYTFFRTTVGLSLIFFLLGLGFGSYSGYSGGKKVLEKLKSPLVIALSVFVFVFLLASFFGADFKFSFWSNFERGEGGFQLITLFVFFVLATLLLNSEKDWQMFFVFWLIAAVFVIGYGIFAHLGQSGYNTFANFMGPKISAQSRFQGSLGNPAYTAPYLLLAAIYAFYLFINSASKVKKGVLLALIAIFLVFFWLAQTRGTFLGLVAGGFMFFAYLIFNAKKGKWKFWLIGILAILLTIGGTLYYFRNTKFVEQMPGGRLFQISLSDATAQTRFWTWGSAIKGWEEKPVLGWGPENFSIVFDKYFDTRHFIVGQRSETWFDRAHSVYFDYLSETGVLGLLSYLAVFVVFYIQFFKWWLRNRGAVDYKNLSVQGLIFAVPIAYLVQGIALFDILPIYLNIFAFLAFSNFVFDSPQERDNKEVKKTALDPLIKKSLAILGSVIVVVSVYFGAYLPYTKSQKLINSLGSIQQGTSLQGYEKAFSSALDYYSPVGQEESVKQLGNSTLSILSNQKSIPKDIAEELLKFNLKYFEPLIEFSRGGNASQNILVLGQIYHTMAINYNDINYLNIAIDYYKKGLDNSPRRPQFLYSMLEAYQAKQDYNLAIKTGEEILIYWPTDAKVKQNIEIMKNIK